MTYYLCLVKIDTVQQGKLTREKLGMQEGGQLNPYIIEYPNIAERGTLALTNWAPALCPIPSI